MRRLKPYEETVKMHGLGRAVWLLVALGLLAQAGYMGWRFYLASLGPVGCDWRPGAAIGATAFVLLLAYAAFTKLRLVVDDHELRVRFGPFGLRIPAENIERAEAVNYSWLTYGGWGIRGGFDGSFAYNVMGDRGRGVRITYRNKRGKRRTVLVSSRRPDVLADHLNG